MSNELAMVESGAVAQNGDGAAYALTREEAAVLERVMLDGDLSQLTGPDRVNYYLGLCKSLHLNPMTRPFEYVTFDRKLVLYARKDCAEQLRRIHNVSIIDLRMEQAADLCIVTATARMPNGRTDIDQGIVDTTGLRGQVFANARLKCTTKAKRRVTLSICGLGIMDETEVETVPGARRVRVDEATGEILEPPAALPPAQNATQRTTAPSSGAQATSATICATPGCGATLTPAQYNLSVGKFKRGLCLRHQKEAAAAPAPVAEEAKPTPDQHGRYLILKERADALGVDIEEQRPVAGLTWQQVEDRLALIQATVDATEDRAREAQEVAA